MEENKPFMPPPPKELKNMPPPPPPKAEQVENTEPEVETASELDNSVFSEMENVQTTENVQTEATETAQNVNEVQEEEKSKKKHQSSGGIKTILYWTGFAVCLVAVGVLIYLLVR